MQPNQPLASAFASDFAAGVIEGFYGPPWTVAERRELFDWMRVAGLNTYFYAPKDDFKHRTCWRECFNDAEAAELKALIGECRDRGIRFVFALGPGLTIQFASEKDQSLLLNRFLQVQTLGTTDFAVLFDDIPDSMQDGDRARFGSFAAAQAETANRLYRSLCEPQKGSRFFFCPTPYCGRMRARQLGGTGYLEELGEKLLRNIEVFWTGPEIISREITVEHVKEISAVLQRRPVIWDNLHANDYDGRRFYCGPYAGRPADLKDHVGGLLLNPNTEFPLNFVPIRTLGEYLRCGGEWDPRRAYLSALREWNSRFATVGQGISFDELLLFADCFYLPYEDGAAAADLLARVTRYLSCDPRSWGTEVQSTRGEVIRLRDTCARMAELRDRGLFNALSRRIWELREEMDLTEKVLAQLPSAGCAVSDFHLPGTYRGGFVARLQRMLVHDVAGRFSPVREENSKAI